MSVKTIQDIHDAIVDYISNNLVYESDTALTETAKKISRCTNIEEIFRTPILDRLFNFSNSLEWLYFICFIINVINDEKIEIPSNFDMSFSVNSAIVFISNTFNSINKNLYKEYIDSSDDED